MCGIAGLVTRDGSPPDRGVLDRMAAALIHRGPDGSGSHVAGSVGLAHTRLAIIDLVTGDQPLYGAGGMVLVANGEIYNDPALRRLFPEWPFQTGSDCEPPLALQARDGDGFAEALRGMYAIALGEPQADRLTLVRDPFGIKPLYVAEGDFGLAFASQPCALLASGLITAEVDPLRRAELLQLQFTTGAETIFRGIRRLHPGETMVVEKGCAVRSRQRPAFVADGPPLTDEGEALAALEAALVDSVTVHQRSDVPYGMFLSGGIDSATILALMSRLNDRPVLAFTAGFPGTAVHDERDHARAVARAAGAEHVEVAVTEDDFWAHLPAIAACMDDPAADYAIVPTWLLARAARPAVKVILSGEGGDELFGGYGRYRGAMRPWPLTRAMRRKGTFDGQGIVRPAVLDGWRAGYARVEAAVMQAGGTRLKRAQRLDMADWLPNDLLVKLDRCLMAHGIEGRVPFLDPAVAGVAARLSDHLCVRDGQGKWLLRRWLDAALPEAQAFAPKKGFTVPVAEWIAARGSRLGPLVAADPGIAEIAEPGAVVALFRDTAKGGGFARWSLLFYALWHRRHVQGNLCDGDVFDVLTDWS